MCTLKGSFTNKKGAFNALIMLSVLGMFTLFFPLPFMISDIWPDIRFRLLDIRLEKIFQHVKSKIRTNKNTILNSIPIYFPG